MGVVLIASVGKAVCPACDVFSRSELRSVAVRLGRVGADVHVACERVLEHRSGRPDKHGAAVRAAVLAKVMKGH